MEKLKKYLKGLTLAQIIDFILTNIALFLILFAWSRFIFKKSGSLVPFFVILAILVGWNTIKVSFKSHKKSFVVPQNESEKWAYFVSTQNESANLDFLISLYGNEAQKLSANLFLLPNGVGIGFDFFENELSDIRALKIVRFAKEQNIKKVAIYCIDCDKKIKMFLENIKDIEVAVCDKNCLVYKTKKAGLAPPNIFEQKPKNKIKFKEFLSISLSRQKAKGYFLSGVLIFFCSLIVRRNIYYVLMSSLLFLLSILSLRQKQAPIEHGFWE